MIRSSEILTQAAMRIDNGRNGFACVAIQDATFREDCWEWHNVVERRALMHFQLLSPTRKIDFGDGWFGSPRRRINQERRVLALLFATAIAESKGD